MKIGGKMFYVG